MANAILEHELEEILQPCRIHEACLNLLGNEPSADPRAPRAPRKEVTPDVVEQFATLRRRGLLYREIGDRLGYHPSTVKRHLAQSQGVVYAGR